MRVALGHSDEVDTIAAVRATIAGCSAELDGEVPKALLVFASVEYDHETMLAEFARAWPGVPLIGGTSDGELSSAMGFRHDSIVVTAFAGEGLRLHCGLGCNLSEDIDGAVAGALAGLGSLEPELCLTLFAPSTNSSAVLSSLSRQLPNVRCPVVGGLTGDHRDADGPVANRQFFGTEALQDACTLLFFSGDFSYGVGVGSGWFPIGEKFRVERSEEHVLHLVGGRSAAKLYQEHYGELEPVDLGEYPIAVFGDDERWALRAVLGSDSEQGSLQFAGEVPMGSLVSMTEVLPDGLLQGTTDSIDDALRSYPGLHPEIAFLFSCAGRKWVLGTEAEKEIDLVRERASAMGWPDLKIVGLYVFGEIGPQAPGSKSQFHNETCVSLVLGQ